MKRAPDKHDRGLLTARRRRRLVLALCLLLGLVESAPAAIERLGGIPCGGHHLHNARGPAVVLPLWRLGERQNPLAERWVIAPGSRSNTRPAMPATVASVSTAPARSVETLPPHWAACHLTI